jgi:hypothetical protein
MAAEELTGADPSELETLESEYYESRKYQKYGIPFEVAYCLNKIAKQPDWYDGPQRYCKRNAARLDDDEHDGEPEGPESYAVCCHTHGGHVTKHGKKSAHHLENPATAAITHGTYADDEHLKMDFNDDEQELYDRIMEDWPEIYDWPDRSEDPARYRILRRVAVNEVRSLRQEDYLDDHEVHVEEIPTEAGIQEKEVENPLAREYRLLMSEVTDQMKELGLTPKERQKMDTLSAQENKEDAVSEIARDALNDGDNEYDPTEFDDDSE